jgi:hypothetical protein
LVEGIMSESLKITLCGHCSKRPFSFSKCALAPPLRASIRPRFSASFPSLGPIASGRRGRPTRLSGRNFGSLIVQQTRGSLAEPFKCKRQGAWRTIAGYETVHMIRKGQACWRVCVAKRTAEPQLRSGQRSQLNLIDLENFRSSRPMEANDSGLTIH